MLKELRKHKIFWPEQGQKILVAMSGGVDSSVAAAILKERQHNVCGAFLNLGQANYKKALDAAKEVAKKIGIPLEIIDLRKEFKKEVINYFLKTYQAGDTPNPCVVCNQRIKFGLLFKLMKKQRFDYLATGHYVRLRREFPNIKLFTARDKTKDQSYFLWTLTQKQLKYCLFPVGVYTKEKVRKLAKKYKLPVAQRKESQDICFLPLGAREFLIKKLEFKKGEIVTANGKSVGVHSGLPFYTIGQRVPIGGIGPYYVFGKNPRKNQLIVIHKNDKESFHKEIVLKNVNWISGKPPRSRKVLVRIRYRQSLVSAKIIFHASRYILRFDQPVKFVAPGQSAVFYGKRNELLGGGVII